MWESEHSTGHVLTTARTVLVPLQEQHLATLVRLFPAEEVARYLGSPGPMTLDKANDLVAQSERDFMEFGFGIWAMCDSDSLETLGAFALRAVLQTHTLELYLGLRPRHRGKGLTTEGALAVVSHGFGFSNVQRVLKRVAPGETLSEPLTQLFSAGQLELNGFSFLQATRDSYPQKAYP